MRQATTRLHLTKKIIESITPPKSGRVTIYDASVRELGLRVLPSGKRVFVWFKRVNGEAKFELIGYHPSTSVEEARGKAREHSGALEKYRRNDFKGPSPFEHGVVNRSAAESVAEEWLTRVVRDTRTAYEVERILRKEILPACKGKQVSDITRADALRILDAIKDRGKPIAANRTLSILQRWLKWCVGRGYLEASPVATIEAPSEEKSRDRVLSDDELSFVWNAAGELPYPDGAFVRLLILTAQRRREVAGMHWEDVDLERALWTLPAEQTKADRVTDVPLAPEAVKILKSLPRHEGPHVFTTGNGRKAINGFSKLKQRLDAEILTLRKAASDESPLVSWTLHDLRRTVATHAAESGVLPIVLSALLNHSLGPQQGITSVYNRYKYAQERREALEAWAQHVLTLAKPKRLKVARRA